MRVTPVDHPIDLMPVVEAGARAPGLHISDIYNALYKQLEPDRFGGEGGPNTTKMAMGLAWEQYLEQRFGEWGVNAQRPSEQTTKEGIAYNPDLLIASGSSHHPDRIGEIKLTYMKESADLRDPKFDKWLTQVKAYGYHLSISRARFYTLFVNGNYKSSRDPVFRGYDIDFTRQELDDNWAMLMNFARHTRML